MSAPPSPTLKTRVWLAVLPNLLLVVLAVFLPHDGEDRGPVLLSLAGNHHFVILHFPVVILMLIPLFECWDRHDEAGPLIRRLSVLGAISIWTACVLGILAAHYNGSDYGNLDNHLWAGVAASFLASGSWLLLSQKWRVRVAGQVVAMLTMVVAAHIGGEKVHGDLFTPNREAIKAGEREISK